MRAPSLCTGDDLTSILERVGDHDLVFIPNYLATSIGSLPYISYGLNTVSFPEMAAESVRQYLRLIAPKLRGFFMSVNHRFKYDGTKQIVGIDDMLAEHFTLFPKIDDYRVQCSIPETEYDGTRCRPTFVGFTDTCAPLSDVELRCISHNKGNVIIRSSSLTAAAVFEDVTASGLTKL
jgi:hypothetical protein